MNNFEKGLNKDVIPKLQPPGTYRYALNSVLESEEGDYGVLINELGNSSCVSTPYPIIGAVQTDSQDFIVFLTDDVNSEIGILNTSTCTYKTLINDACLNFSSSNPVYALFRIRKGCERTVYFTDRLNPYRTINIDDIDQYLNDDGSLDCNEIKLTPPYSVPNLNIADVQDTGGRLEVGAYQFALRYLDEEENPTNWIYVTRHVSIFPGLISNLDYDAITGAIPTISTDAPEEGAVPNTTKSIVLEIDNLDRNFTYYQLAAIHSNSTTGEPSATWLLDTQFIDSNSPSSTYTYRGPDTSAGHFEIDLTEITVDTEIIDVVQHHVQKDNSLILSGFESIPRKYAEYQQAANQIEIDYIVEEVELDNPSNVGSDKNPLTPYSKLGYMGGEVYAFAIQYLHDDGTWSPAHHIPGRRKVGSDKTIVGYSVPDPNTLHLEQDRIYERWEVYDTSTAENTVLGIPRQGKMSYYEADTTYLSLIVGPFLLLLVILAMFLVLSHPILLFLTILLLVIEFS